MRWRRLGNGRWARIQDHPGVLLLIAAGTAAMAVYATYRALRLPAGDTGDHLVGITAPFWFGFMTAAAVVRLIVLRRRRKTGEHHLGQHGEADRRVEGARGKGGGGRVGL